MEMVTEEFGVLDTFSLHDGAIHGLIGVDEDTIAIGIGVEGTLATVLPVPVAVGAVGAAAEVALVLSSVKRIGNADARSRTNTTISTREGSAVDT